MFLKKDCPKKIAKEALKQIKEMQYHERYVTSNKPITLSFNLDNKDLTINYIQEDV